MALAKKSFRPPRSIGEAIKQARQEPVWKLGQRLGVNPTNVEALERGQRPLTDLANRLLDEFGIDRQGLADSQLKALADELAAIPARDRVFLLEAFRLALRRYNKAGVVPKVRLGETLAASRADGPDLDEMAAEAPAAKVAGRPRSSGDRAAVQSTGRDPAPWWEKVVREMESRRSLRASPA